MFCGHGSALCIGKQFQVGERKREDVSLYVGQSLRHNDLLNSCVAGRNVIWGLLLLSQSYLVSRLFVAFRKCAIHFGMLKCNFVSAGVWHLFAIIWGFCDKRIFQYVLCFTIFLLTFS